VNLFFDVDYTILGVDSGLLRPRVRDVFEQLCRDKHDIFIWSGAGDRRNEMDVLGLTAWVRGVFTKPVEQYERNVQRMIERSELPVPPDLVIDDSIPIVRALGGIVVIPFGGRTQDDQEMERVYRIVTEHSRSDPGQQTQVKPLYLP